MVLIPPTNSVIGAVVMDANVSIGISAKEADKHSKAQAALIHYLSLGYTLFVPGVLVAETLYILCKKAQRGDLAPEDHAQAIQDFIYLMIGVESPPTGDIALIRRAEEVRSGYGCSRSADGLYIALAEYLARTRPTVLLEFRQ